MDHFYLNGDLWVVKVVEPNDRVLVDRTGVLTVATTDPVSKTVFLSKALRGEFLIRVLVHELGHCTMISFNLIEELHRMVNPEYWITAEEWVCNFIADYGQTIFSIAFRKIGYKAWEYIPKELEKLVS